MAKNIEEQIFAELFHFAPNKDNFLLSFKSFCVLVHDTLMDRPNELRSVRQKSSANHRNWGICLDIFSPSFPISCTFSTLATHFACFVLNERILQMLSVYTRILEDFSGMITAYSKKTAVNFFSKYLSFYAVNDAFTPGLNLVQRANCAVRFTLLNLK